MPSVTNSTYCQGVTANTLAGNATSTNGGILSWYALASGGTATATPPTPSTGSDGIQIFYVSQTIDGIESDRAAIIVTVNAAPATLAVNITQPTCNINTASFSLTNGVANATYLINAGLYSNTSGFFTNLTANATYSITQRDPNTGCLSVAITAIVNPALIPPAIPSFVITQPDCLTSTGKITITNNIGAAFSYSIDGTNYQASPIFSGLNSGNYSVTVVNGDACASNIVVATINPQPLPSKPLLNGTLTPTNITICAGTATTLTASLTSSPTAGANNSNLSYQWYKNNIIIPGAGNTTFNPTSSGDYSVIATNSLGCTSAASGTVSVTLNPLPTASITGGAELAFADCTQTKIVLTANTNANAPSYQWQVLDVVNNIYTNVGSPTSGTQNLTGQFSSFEVGVAGSYKVVITSNGCSTSSAVTKIVSAPAVNALALTTICQGTNVNLSATGSFTSYQWQQNTGGGFVNITTNGVSSILSVTNGGDYRVIATNGAGNSTSCPITITSNSLPVSNPTIEPSSLICAGTPAIITANTFGTSPFSYQWNVDGNPIFGAIANTYSATIGGDYAVKVTDANGCEAVSPASTLTVNALPARPTGINGVNVVIDGSTQTYSITPVSGASSYTWTLPNGWIGNSITNSITAVVGNNGGTITVVANANGCTSPVQALIVSLGSLTDDAATAYINIPSSGNISLNDIMPSGTTYGQPTQITGATITVNTDGTYSFTATAAGTYTYTIPVCAPGQSSNCPTETLVITVPVNILIDDAATAYLNISKSGNVFTNDTVPLGTSYGQPTQITGATITVNTDGTYSFTATAAGTYTYTIPVCAPGQSSNCPTETLVITVPENIITPDIAVTNVSVPVLGKLTTNDIIPTGTTYSQPGTNPSNPLGGVITVSTNGTYSFTATLPGKYIYYVPTCAPGQISNCPLTTLEITVLDPTVTNNKPIANNDVVITPINTATSVNILSNDKSGNSGISLNPSSVTVPVQPAHGSVVVNGDGTLTYSPSNNYVGTDSVLYTVCDNSPTPICQNAAVYFYVSSANTARTLAADDFASVGGSSNEITANGNVLTNDKNTAGASLTASLVTGPSSSQGTLVFNADGSYVFTPVAGFSGPVDILYTACTGATPPLCATATLHILVNIIRVDTDGDGVPDNVDLDNDNDGILDSVESAACSPSSPTCDTDGDGISNSLDLDSDGDGINDATESGGIDVNGDGKVDGGVDVNGVPISANGGLSPADADGDGKKNPYDVDSDGDGIPDSVEKGSGATPVDTDGDGVPDYLDTDSDNDGIPDGIEKGSGATPVDTDGDGIPDYKDVDSDGDGILDSIEKGSGSTPVDTDGDGVPDYKDLDSDNDGIPDSIEKGPGATPVDTDGDGVPDYKDLDSDNDGILDSIEKGSGATPVDTDGDGVPDYKDLDSDNDGILDSIEKGSGSTPVDTDGDGVPDFQDLDSDNDGILDSIEKGSGATPVDTDGDGVPDYKDLDSDNDGIPDSIEKGSGSTPVDTDGDGVPDYKDLDSDNDGILDSIEKGSGATPVDTDGDGIPDYRDLDSDNDGIPDSIEKGADGNKPVDTDGDGIPDYRDVDSDNDGIPDSIEKGADGNKPVDTDGDGIPDYLDLDSDNDGIPDSIEKGADGNKPVDTDGDGIPDYLDLDSDNDGIPDSIEKGVDGNKPVDTDGDGVPDYRDVDSDNDGIPDSIEKGADGNKPVDTDGDGIPDYRDLDSDNDGIPDTIEKGADGNKPVDTDGDGIPDYRDLDSDNDGILDSIEKGADGNKPVDTDGDGIPDYRDLDSDADGVTDADEKRDGTNPIDPCSLKLQSQTMQPSDAWMKADCNGDKVPNGEVLIVTKYVSKPVVQVDGSMQIKYTVALRNPRPDSVKAIAIKDDLTKVFLNPINFTVTGTQSTGSLIKTSTYDGRGNIDLVTNLSSIAGYGADSVMIEVTIIPNGFSGDIDNIADVEATTKWGAVKRQSIDTVRSAGRLTGSGVANRFNIPKEKIIIPEAFSPNGDGFNDYFEIIHPSSTTISLAVYNRWGNVVYMNADYQNDWRGKGKGNFLGQELPEGTYYYIINATEKFTKQVSNFAGFLNLKR